ncbi:energy-coupling factor ABC transporter permease [Oscillospiraceae bacterium PP1C4]
MMLMSTSVHAMHIAEGFLPVGWCITWGVAFLPFLVYGLFSIKNKCTDNSRVKMLLAMAGAYCFVLSALKMPSVSGSSSHPTGTGLGAILFGPAAMAVIGLIVLLFQALLLAHGGLTTLGANAFSMAVAGPFVGFGVYLIAKKCKAPMWMSVFLCAFTADLFTYIVTSFQLAFAFHNETVSFASSLAQFMTVFAVTQIPLAIIEGILTVLIYQAISSLCADELKLLTVNA